jgi:SPX domain protein involved in polyphosphate accumulation
VAAFRNIKGDELSRRIEHSESVVRKIISAAAASEEKPDASKLSNVEEELGRITVEVNELSKFTRLNYSGFMKVSSS